MSVKRASVLISTLWVLSFLSVFAINLAYTTRSQLYYARHLQNRVKAYYLAKAGIERATSELSNDTEWKVDSFSDTWAYNEDLFKEMPFGEGFITVSYQLQMQNEEGEDAEITLYGVMDESSKININNAPTDVLATLFKRIGGVEIDESSNIAGAIQDWRDADIVVSRGGAENKYYQGLDIPYECKNGKFQVLEELLLVKGMTPEIFFKIKETVTVYGAGKVNINTAGYNTLYALGLSESLCRQIIEFRQGSDGELGTEDDSNFTSVQGIRNVGPLFTEESIQINKLIADNMLSVESNVFRVNSTGQLKTGESTYSRSITCVLQRNTLKGPQILYWYDN